MGRWIYRSTGEVWRNNGSGERVSAGVTGTGGVGADTNKERRSVERAVYDEEEEVGKKKALAAISAMVRGIIRKKVLTNNALYITISIWYHNDTKIIFIMEEDDE